MALTAAPIGLSGKIAVITGGTQGLGETVARLFAARGCAGIVVTGRNASRGHKVADALMALGCRALFVPADLARLEDCRAIMAATDRAFGRIDVLVNAAASTDRGTIVDTTPEVYEYIMAVNVRAP